MRRALTGGFLILSILGTFTVQAGAAEAFADSIAELIHPEVIEPGDADDSPVAEPSVKAEAYSLPARPGDDLPVFEGIIPLREAEHSGFRSDVRRFERSSWPSLGRVPLRVLLQVFLC